MARRGHDSIVPLLAEMSELQRKVFDDLQAVLDDRERWMQRIDDQNQAAAIRTLEKQLNKHGAGNVPVVLGAEIAEMIAAAAEASAGSILDTYDLALATEILAIGEAVSEAEYRTYRGFLIGNSAYAVSPGLSNWAARRGTERVGMISLAETAMTINLAVELFYQFNEDLDGPAEVVPLVAACEYCQAGVDGNPYPSVRAANNAGPWPAHPRCIHYVELTAPQIAADSAEVWAGGG